MHMSPQIFHPRDWPGTYYVYINTAIAVIPKKKKKKTVDG